MTTSSSTSSSAPAGYRFPREVIAVAVRWYLRYGASYRDVEEPLAERGIEVEHVTIYRWVQTFTSEFMDAARPARYASGDRWYVDETYVKVAGRWSYLYRAVDQHGQVIDVLVSTCSNAAAAREFFTRALRVGPPPVEVTPDRAPVYPRVIEEVLWTARHVTEQYANNRVETDHGRLKARLRPMRGLKRLASTRTISAGHAFVQNLRRGHYKITADLPAHARVRVAFDELASCMRASSTRCDRRSSTQQCPHTHWIHRDLSACRQPGKPVVEENGSVAALRPEERWAAACIEASVGCSVVQHDDGSRPGMDDLDMVCADGRTGAVEVTSATHTSETQFWKLATSGDRWTDTRLRGAWLVQAAPTASVKALRARLPGLLAELELRGVNDLSDARSDDLLEKWELRGIVSACQSGTDHRGAI